MVRLISFEPVKPNNPTRQRAYIIIKRNSTGQSGPDYRWRRHIRHPHTRRPGAAEYRAEVCGSLRTSNTCRVNINNALCHTVSHSLVRREQLAPHTSNGCGMRARMRTLDRAWRVCARVLCVLYFLAGEFHTHDANMLGRQRPLVRNAFEPNSPPDRFNNATDIGSSISGSATTVAPLPACSPVASSHVALQPGTREHVGFTIIWSPFHKTLYARQRAPAGRPVLIVAQIFAVMPLYGICTAHAAELKFVWWSGRMLHSVLVSGAVCAMTVMSIIWGAAGPTTVARLGSVLFVGERVDSYVIQMQFVVLIPFKIYSAEGYIIFRV